MRRRRRKPHSRSPRVRRRQIYHTTITILRETVFTRTLMHQQQQQRQQQRRKPPTIKTASCETSTQRAELYLQTGVFYFCFCFLLYSKRDAFDIAPDQPTR